jgi:hypothetical protein
MYSHLNLIAGQEHIVDLRRAADHDRLVRAARADRRGDSTPIKFAGRGRCWVARAFAWARQSATTSA